MLLIAEIGVNHNGSVEKASDLIHAAYQSGANAVKFQHFSADKLATSTTPKVAYQLSTSDQAETHHEMLRKLQITGDIEKTALQMCKELGLEFISTPYDPEAAEHLISLGCNYVKTASADIVDLRIHEVISKSDVQPLVATGMATYDEIREMLDIYANSARSPVLLHCVSNYPCSAASLNLRVILRMMEDFSQVGFSDHSVDEKAAVIAYSMGCRVFEKHFTLDKDDDGPDHKASSTPEEFKTLSAALLEAEVMLGDPVKTVQPEEQAMREISRKSVHSTRSIKQGDVFTNQNITMIRPGKVVCQDNVILTYWASVPLVILKRAVN